MLEVSDLSVSYGEIRALSNVSITVEEGEIVTVIGANGAGKTTLLRTISNLMDASEGDMDVSEGDITFERSSLLTLSPDDIVRKGVVHVPEGRQIFPELTVSENLTMGSYSRDDEKATKKDLEEVFDLFPRLEERQGQLGKYLSGGEQQMLAIGRGLMSDPKILLLDEPSLGLAPQIVEEVEEIIRDLNDRNITILLIEQNADMAMRVADRAYILQNGEIQMEGNAEKLAEQDEVREAYLGL